MSEFLENAGLAALMGVLPAIIFFVYKWIVEEATDPGLGPTDRHGDDRFDTRLDLLKPEADFTLGADDEQSDPAKREEIERALQDLLNGAADEHPSARPRA